MFTDSEVRERERERERNINMRKKHRLAAPGIHPDQGLSPQPSMCLSGDQAPNILVYGMMLQLSHTSRAVSFLNLTCAYPIAQVKVSCM